MVFRAKQGELELTPEEPSSSLERTAAERTNGFSSASWLIGMHFLSSSRKKEALESMKMHGFKVLTGKDFIAADVLGEGDIIVWIEDHTETTGPFVVTDMVAEDSKIIGVDKKNKENIFEASEVYVIKGMNNLI